MRYISDRNNLKEDQSWFEFCQDFIPRLRMQTQCTFHGGKIMLSKFNISRSSKIWLGLNYNVNSISHTKKKEKY